MENRNVLTKILTVGGTVLVWLPLLAPLLFSVMALIRAGQLRIDYLMPAELFLSVLVGGGLLLWAAWRLRSHRALIGGALGAAIALLVGGQALAVVTGLASGEAEPTGWRWGVVLGALTFYDAAVVAIGVGGALLLRNLFDTRRLPAGSA